MSIFNTDLSKIPVDNYTVKSNGDLLGLNNPITRKLFGYTWVREKIFGVNNEALENYLKNLNTADISEKDLLEKNIQLLADNGQISAELETKLLYKIKGSKSP